MLPAKNSAMPMTGVATSRLMLKWMKARTTVKNAVQNAVHSRMVWVKAPASRPNTASSNCCEDMAPALPASRLSIAVAKSTPNRCRIPGVRQMTTTAPINWFGTLLPKLSEAAIGVVF